jgi:hypothetical protein
MIKSPKFISLLLFLLVLGVPITSGCNSRDVNLNSENIDGVRLLQKADTAELRKVFGTENNKESDEKGVTWEYHYYSISVDVHVNDKNQIDSISGSADDSSRIKTSRGIGKNSSLEDIQKAYGTNFKETKTGTENLVIYADPKSKIQLEFKLNSEDKVVRVRLQTI